ncbi:hypothetical protein [Pseudonocardia sp. TRM90224]|uniref:hypothetical protein n=1 Tax=Pseudonocardia sp. TRM90224 TaxID=2812678 RepID=UPI001E36D2DB|nr:hypothetical protein [Pseudonocardia sp. TRM90224]
MSDEQPDVREKRSGRPLVGWVVAAVGALALGVAMWNPLNVQLGPHGALYRWIGLLVVAGLVIWAAYRSFRHRFARAAVAAVGVCLVPFAIMMTSFALISTDLVDSEEVLASQDGLQLVHVTATDWIDPFHRVELRRSIGPLQQAVVVWEGNPEGDAPRAARFTLESEVEVVVVRYRADCPYRTGFDPLTLTPHVRHDDSLRRGGGC